MPHHHIDTIKGDYESVTHDITWCSFDLARVYQTATYFREQQHNIDFICLLISSLFLNDLDMLLHACIAKFPIILGLLMTETYQGPLPLKEGGREINWTCLEGYFTLYFNMKYQPPLLWSLHLTLYNVLSMTVARQQFSKHIPKVTQSTVGLLLLDSRSLSTLHNSDKTQIITEQYTNCWRWSIFGSPGN
jgi:hypothetical protein